MIRLRYHSVISGQGTKRRKAKLVRLVTDEASQLRGDPGIRGSEDPRTSSSQANDPNRASLPSFQPRVQDFPSVVWFVPQGSTTTRRGRANLTSQDIIYPFLQAPFSLVYEALSCPDLLARPGTGGLFLGDDDPRRLPLFLRFGPWLGAVHSYKRESPWTRSTPRLRHGRKTGRFLAEIKIALSAC